MLRAPEVQRRLWAEDQFSDLENLFLSSRITTEPRFERKTRRGLKAQSSQLASLPSNWTAQVRRPSGAGQYCWLASEVTIFQALAPVNEVKTAQKLRVYDSVIPRRATITSEDYKRWVTSSLRVFPIGK